MTDSREVMAHIADEKQHTLAEQREKILAMVAGRNLDALVAEQVMGWVRDDPAYTRFEPLFIRPEGGSRFLSELPPYSTDPGAAWSIIEELKDDWPTLMLEFGDGWYDATLMGHMDSGRSIHASARSGPLAVARAALLARLETGP